MPPKKKSSKDAANILYVGIDLGTSRSAVVASNGERGWVESYVAWPKDFVARKMLGDRVLFGEEAINNRMSVTLVRPLQYGIIRDGTSRDVDAVKELIRHVIEMVHPAEDQEVYAAVGVPAEALKVNKIAIRDAVREYANSLMVVSEPFAVAYGQGTLNNSLIVDIGAGTVDFCVMHGTMPGEEDQRTLNSAGDHIDRQLYEILSEKYPNARFSETSVRHYKENFGFVGENKSSVRVKVPVEGRFTDHDITKELKQACESILPAISETIIDLISRYDPEFQETVRKNIYIAGGGSQIRGVAEAIEEGLQEYGSFKVTAVNDPLYAGAEGALALAQDMPDEYWEDMS